MVESSKYSKKFLNEMLRQMLLIRRFEEASAQAYGIRKIGGFCHLYIGQEAVAVGSIAACDLSRDYILTSYRDHGHALACGMDAKLAMAELFGKHTGCSKGKGGSMHFFDAQNHMLGGNGIVGSQIPVAMGVAFASAYRKDGGVTLCYFGDGAIHQGAFHESMNLSAVWNIPVIYIVENNRYGMGTSIERVSGSSDFKTKADGYGLDGFDIDGMSVLAVYEGIKKAIKLARKGKPLLIDVKTYRYRGHSMSDPAKYRDKADVERYKKQDPILQLRTVMEDNKMLTTKQFDDIDKEIKQEVADAVAFAEESDEPPLSEMYTDILA